MCLLVQAEAEQDSEQEDGAASHTSSPMGKNRFNTKSAFIRGTICDGL